MAIDYPRGSEWRRWDLQIHTPFSILNNNFGDDFDAYAKCVFESAIQHDIAVIGVTDYFTVAGYRELCAIQRNRDRLVDLLGDESAARAAAILLLPNIEFRARDVVRLHGRDSRVNFHVIFSNELAADEIEEQFLRELRFTTEAAPDATEQSLSLTLEHLEELGRQLKEDHEPFRALSDLVVGMQNAFIAWEEVFKVLERQDRRFKDRYLFVVPPDEDLSEINWDGQGHLVRKLPLQKADMFFSANPNTIEFGLGLKHDSIDAFLQEFKSKKPCIHGSDAHAPDELFAPAEGRYLWIRADPTFAGLRQLLHEPADRVFIGDRPRELIRVTEIATKYISELAFAKTSKASTGEEWFGGSIPLNPGLVAIIGKKGSGKSALADVIGLLGRARTREEFSFLSSERFLSPKRRLGGMFEATMRWVSGDSITEALDAEMDPTEVERVKYIPQSYLEKICGELRETSPGAFDRELEDVIFSHVQAEERLGQTSLRDLIDFRTKEKEAAVAQLVAKVKQANGVIVELEGRVQDAHKKALEAEIAQRESELRAHEAVKPTPVPEPQEDDTPEAAEVKAALEKAVSAIQSLDEEIDKSRRELDQCSRELAAIDRLVSRIANLEAALEDFYASSALDGETLGLDPRTLVAVAVDRVPLDAIRKQRAGERETLRAALDERDAQSLIGQVKAASKTAEAIRLRLDEPNRRYQEHLRQLAEWTRRRDALQGSDDEPGTLLGLRRQLAELKDVPERIRQERKARQLLVRQIFEAKQGLLDDYRQLHSPVQRFIENHPVSRETEALEFTANMMVENFTGPFLGMINRGRRGSFHGDKEARERARTLLDAADWTTPTGVERFLSEVERHLTTDLSDTPPKEMQVTDQLRDRVTPEELYNFLFALDYLRPRFELRWQDKTLDQLSPGERGTLLLVFYLLIDRRDIPLVIDQPEENLDNETIALLLVPAMKYAKRRRQIVIVTHNPNLAVVCDAEQVVHASIDKGNGNRITYISGAIEDREITELIVNVLEGTMPAFELRDAKYEALH